MYLFSPHGIYDAENDIKIEKAVVSTRSIEEMDFEQESLSEDIDASSTSPPSGSSSFSPEESESKRWDPNKCAVTGIGVGYGLDVFEPFVGSLRSTGYKGHIILGIASNAPSSVINYLTSQNVTIKKLNILKPKQCTHYGISTADRGITYDKTCFQDYPSYKITWGRFAITKDWILDCEECTDGIMLTDLRDAYFQSNPFTYMEPKELMLFEEIYPDLTNENWLTEAPVSKCKDYTVGPTPMLCSGSTMGSREGILNYLDVMKEEFDEWNKHEKCRSNMDGDDQSIHNYLYYTNRFKDASTIPHRTGPIHVVGWKADKIFRKTIKEYAEKHNVDIHAAESAVNSGRYYGTEENWRDWLGPEYNLTDPKTGYILNLDGKPSPQVHQFDRFGYAFNRGWYDHMNREVWNKKRA